MRCRMFKHFILPKETLFCMTFVGWPTGELCVKSLFVHFLSVYCVQFLWYTIYIYHLELFLQCLISFVQAYRTFDTVQTLLSLIFLFCVSYAIFLINLLFFFYSYLITLNFTYNIYTYLSYLHCFCSHISHIYIISVANRLTSQLEMSYIYQHYFYKRNTFLYIFYWAANRLTCLCSL